MCSPNAQVSRQGDKRQQNEKDIQWQTKPLRSIFFSRRKIENDATADDRCAHIEIYTRRQYRNEDQKKTEKYSSNRAKKKSIESIDEQKRAWKIHRKMKKWKRDAKKATKSKEKNERLTLHYMSLLYFIRFCGRLWMIRRFSSASDFFPRSFFSRIVLLSFLSL